MHPLFQEYYNKNMSQILNWDSGCLPTHSSNAAIIIENRINDEFSLIIREHLRFLDDKFMLIVFAGKENIAFIEKQLQGITYTLFEIPFITNAANFLHEYNRWLGSYAFWNKLLDFGIEKALFFQADSLILRKGIEDFMKYDYIGAIWDFPPYLGNGGFSLRSVSIMRKIAFLFDWEQEGQNNEDVFFSKHIMEPSLHCTLPTREEAMRFSVEKLYGEGSFGCHAPYTWQTEQQTRKILGI